MPKAVLRDGADAKALKTDLASASQAVVVGGGYIGLEAAASLRKHGLSVTVVEAADRLLARVASPSISSYYQSVVKAMTHHPDRHRPLFDRRRGAYYRGRLLMGGISHVIYCWLALRYQRRPWPRGLQWAMAFDLTLHQTSDLHIHAIGDNVMAEYAGLSVSNLSIMRNLVDIW